MKKDTMDTETCFEERQNEMIVLEDIKMQIGWDVAGSQF